MRILLVLTSFFVVVNAHFLTLQATTTNVTQESKTIELSTAFVHPFEQTGMHLEKPTLSLNKQPLELTKTKLFNEQAWKSSYTFKRPGLYQFVVEPVPYFEPSEGKYIKHVPKLQVSAFGVEDGWDEPLGLAYEIVPLTKPFALYAGNLFQGQVLVHGKPAANVEVEVELYNSYGLKAPSDAHITQLVKTDANGVFSFAMNHKGWWGFAALIEEGQKEYKGKMYPIENGALMWVYAY